MGPTLSLPRSSGLASGPAVAQLGPPLPPSVTAQLQIGPGDDPGWALASQYLELKRELRSTELRERARRIAAQAILRRAAHVLGASRRSTRPAREPYSAPDRGELDPEATLEEGGGWSDPRPENLVVEVREERRVSVALMLDTSLSMTGKKLALAGVAAAVLALRLDVRDYAVVLFSTRAHVIKRLRQHLPVERVLERLLDVPALGYTNIEDGLRVGYEELAQGRTRHRFGIILTDGVATEGGDPRPWAARYPGLHVLIAEDYKMDVALCREMARLGRGQSYLVESYDRLPAVMRDLTLRLAG